MITLPCLTRRWLRFAILMLCGGAGIVSLEAQQLSGYTWTARCPRTGTIMPVSAIGEGTALVTVVPRGKDPENLELYRGENPMKLKSAAFDPVSRIWVVRPAEEEIVKSPGRPITLRHEAGVKFVYPKGKGNMLGCVKQIGGKVLPFALIHVGFYGPAPEIGTPLLSVDGKISALYFQNAQAKQEGYALPAAAVIKVKRDLLVSRKLVKGWLGLTLRPENPILQITQIQPGSPAEKVGIQPNDLLLAVNDLWVTNYADAADAFFYLSPGVPVTLKFARGTQQWEVSVTPTKSPE